MSLWEECEWAWAVLPAKKSAILLAAADVEEERNSVSDAYCLMGARGLGEGLSTFGGGLGAFLGGLTEVGHVLQVDHARAPAGDGDRLGPCRVWSVVFVST